MQPPSKPPKKPPPLPPRPSSRSKRPPAEERVRNPPESTLAIVARLFPLLTPLEQDAVRTIVQSLAAPKLH